MRWAGHVACMGDRRGVYRVLMRRPEEKRPLGRPRHRWKENIKMDLQRSGIQKHGMDLSGSGQGQVVGACECGKEPQSSIKCEECLN